MKNIKEKVKEIQQVISPVSSSSLSTPANGFDVMKIKEQMDAYRNIAGVIIWIADSAGNKIRRTIKDRE